MLSHLKLNRYTLTKVNQLKLSFYFKGACPFEIEGRYNVELVAESLVYQVFNATNFSNVAGHFIMKEDAFKPMVIAFCNQLLGGDRTEAPIKIICNISVESVCYEYVGKIRLEPR